MRFLENIPGHEGGILRGELPPLRFVLEEGWAPSGVMANGKWSTGIQYAMAKHEEE